jgi:hypothetical protein
VGISGFNGSAKVIELLPYRFGMGRISGGWATILPYQEWDKFEGSYPLRIDPDIH